ncbi:ATP-dependent DNA ligase [Candidatus Bathyarchaeota archaeon]|nr:MAG: ATP-dependent DNA ligase [Candidatus Bathyarchaeota archaeon]
MKFQELSNLLEQLSHITKRTLMTDMVADFLKKLKEDEVEPAVSMMLGRPFPKWDRRTLDISWTTISDTVKRLSRTDWKEFSVAFRETGDIGSAIQAVFEKNKIHRQITLFESSLTILEVRRLLEAIAAATGHGSRERKERLTESLFSRATPVEAKYITKIMIGEMRTGFHEGLMEIAVSKAFSVPLKTVQKAAMLVGDIGEVAAICKKEGVEGLSKVSLKLFRPIKPMLAQMAENTEEALKEHDGKTAFEYKLDGARIQIHKSNGDVRIFSRRLSDVTKSLPEVVEIVRREVRSKRAILEGEVIALGRDGNPLPFQHLMRRFRRVYDVQKMTEEIPVKLYLFDAIYVDGDSLIDAPYVERRKRLQEIAGNIPLTRQIVTGDPQKAEEFLKEAVDEGHEGLMAKRLDGPYTPGVRGKHWFKIKETLEPLDLVIVAAEYGYGRRHKWLSDYHLAARDGETGEFVRLGKTFKGLTDEEMERMTERLKKIAVENKGHLVVVKPEIVVEVAYNEIQESPRYKCGMALRFARITRIREDKGPEEADTIQRVREIYERQFEKKAKLNH